MTHEVRIAGSVIAGQTKGTTALVLLGHWSMFPDLSIYVPSGAKIHGLRQRFIDKGRGGSDEDLTELELDWTRDEPLG